MLNNSTMLINIVEINRHKAFKLLLVLFIKICGRFEVTEYQIRSVKGKLQKILQDNSVTIEKKTQKAGIMKGESCYF